MDYLKTEASISIRKFKRSNKELSNHANRLLDVSSELRILLLALNGAQEIKIPTTVVIIYQDIEDFFFQSLITSMQGKNRISMSMVRNYTEICRDLLRLLERPNAEELYLNGRKNEDKKIRKQYREMFKFKIPEESQLHAMYNLTSEFGVHARMSMFESAQHRDGLSFLSSKELCKKQFCLSLMTFSSFLRNMLDSLLDKFPSLENEIKDKQRELFETIIKLGNYNEINHRRKKKPKT